VVKKIIGTIDPTVNRYVKNNFQISVSDGFSSFLRVFENGKQKSRFCCLCQLKNSCINKRSFWIVNFALNKQQN
jgi:hypothetical protein